MADLLGFLVRHGDPKLVYRKKVFFQLSRGYLTIPLNKAEKRLGITLLKAEIERISSIPRSEKRIGEIKELINWMETGCCDKKEKWKKVKKLVDELNEKPDFDHSPLEELMSQQSEKYCSNCKTYTEHTNAVDGESRCQKCGTTNR